MNLAHSKFISKLSLLSIGKNNLTEKGAYYLAEATNL